MKALPYLILCAALVTLSGCDWMPGKPKPSAKWEPAESITDFNQLFTENCQGCHGINGAVSGSISFGNPIYFAIVPEQTLKDIIANGVPATRMPAFLIANGGSLTDKQVGIVADGLRSLARGPAPTGPLPPYSAPLGNAQSGQAAFTANCASCHGADGSGIAGKAGSVVDPSYLGLVSDQYLRTITIVGRDDLGCPDFQHRVPGRAMTDAEISDVVAWLASHRLNEFGQPLAPGAAQN